MSSMTALIRRIKEEYVGDTKNLIEKRLTEFKELYQRDDNIIFSELCFCLLTANFQAERSIFIQQQIGDGFLSYSFKELAQTLKKLGHRFPNTRAKYIVLAREKKEEIIAKVKENIPEQQKREWLVKNVKGLGMKEASHFLRNIGFENLAIIDFHIIDLLVEYGIIIRPKTLTKRKYIEVEEKLKEIGRKVNLSLAALDLILWKMETGKVLK